MSQGMRVLCAVALGGAAGAIARAAIEQWLGGGASSVPWSTLSINALGSFLLGMLTVLTTAFSVQWWVKPALGTGLLGGFTTFSAYIVSSLTLPTEGTALSALAYLVLTPLACVGAAALGARSPGLLGLHSGAPPPAQEQE